MIESIFYRPPKIVVIITVIFGEAETIDVAESIVQSWPKVKVEIF